MVICLAALSIFAAYTTQTRVARAEHFDWVRESYNAATSAIRSEEKFELKFVLDPSPAHSAKLSEASQALIQALDEVRWRGGQEDAQLSKDILVLHDRLLLVSDRLRVTMAAGDRIEAQRVAEDEADPIFRAMYERLATAAAVRAAEADSASASVHKFTQGTLVVVPLVFAVGFGLMLLLWRILEGYHRATRETYREIEQLSKLRSEFVSIVSHEFRTPLTGIQGFSEMIRDEKLTVPEMREYAGDINKDARRLARLITDMLDLDRMESGRMTLNSEPVDLNRIVGDTAAQFRLSAADHPIELDLDPRLPMLTGDADRLTQVVTNLLSNAIKYSPSGGAVELRTERAERTVTLTVRDHGIGIAPEQLERIFERYSRVDTNETRSISGTGLGLPIVRQIVQLCDGKVWATSESGRGSVLHVQLPLREAAIAAPLAA